MDFEKLKEASDEGLEVWVKFGDDAEVLVRYISREELKNIIKKARKVLYDRHQKTEEYDDTKGDILLGIAAVKDWKGFTMKGEMFPCTPENIEFLMRKWNAFAKFVNDTCTDLELLIQQEKEKTIKNS